MVDVNESVTETKAEDIKYTLNNPNESYMSEMVKNWSGIS